MSQPEPMCAKAPGLELNVRLSILVLLFLCAFVIGIDGDVLPVRYFREQDLPVIALTVASLTLAHVALPRFTVSSCGGWWPSPRRPWVPVGLLMLVALALWWGSYAIMSDYALTRDEHMVLFDMEIFRRGHLMEPLDPFWRLHARALVPNFLLAIPGQPALVSDYLPVNAMLRAGFATLADPALMNPLLVALAGLALIDIARRLFPDDRPTRWVTLVLFLTSTQLLVNAMTPYAMTAHLAANLCWLSLFLRGGRIGHVCALLIGFAAIGLHQVIFHPLFVLPFLLCRWRDGDRGLIVLYVIAYSLFGLFWITWQTFIVHLADITAASGAAAGAGGFIRQRVLPLLASHSPLTFSYMAFNLARFLAWQNMALLPLLLATAQALRGAEGQSRPLAGGVLLAAIAFATLLPNQGHGWGYRYLHGFLGSIALLGAYGFRALAERTPRTTNMLVLGGTGLTLVLVIPFLLWRTHSFVAPSAHADAVLTRLDADYAVVDTDTVGYQVDLVRNPPDLAQRPIRLASNQLDPAFLEVLCRNGSITFIDRTILVRPGVAPRSEADNPRLQKLHDSLRGRGCLKSSLASR